MWREISRHSQVCIILNPLKIITKYLYELFLCISFGNGCARPGYPGVYTKIEYYNEWIAQIAHQGNSNGNIKVASLSVNFLTFLLIFIAR